MSGLRTVIQNSNTRRGYQLFSIVILIDCKTMVSNRIVHVLRTALHAGHYSIVTATLCALVSGCASHTAIITARPNDSVRDTVTATAAVVAEPLLSADSFIDKFSNDIPAAPECSEIDFLIESAKNACMSDSFAEAGALLRKALLSIREKEDADREWAGADSYYNDVARVYAEEIPGRYADSIPDDVSMLVFQKQLSRSLDTLKLSASDSAVLKKLSCQKGITYNFPIQWNDRVYRSISFFARGRKGPLDAWLARAARYLPVMRKMFADSGLPSDLAYLPLIESGFNPLALSRRKASGIWQFIAPTGTRYGLRKNYWLDERRDPVKSTGAAIGYLRKLYTQFNDWYLAIAAYNCGENGVANAVARASSPAYWNLSLPRETKNYVPEFIAALIVAKNPECFGYAPVHGDTFDPDTVLIDECLNLQSIADSIGIASADLKTLNPHILHWCTPPSVKLVCLYLPKGLKGRFSESFARSPEAFRVAWYQYQVKTGEKLSTIAALFKVPLEAVKSINSLDASCRLSVGKQVFIPIPLHVSTAQAAIIADDLARNGRPPLPKADKNGQIRYRVRSGDTVWDLARLFHMRPEDICANNGIQDNQSLRAGQYLVLQAQEAKQDISPVALPAATKKAPVNNSPERYQVLPGETLYSIAKKLGATVSELAAANGMTSDHPVIFAGQNLFCPPHRHGAANAPMPDTLFYRVCKGDNLLSLAASFSVGLNDICAANNLTTSSKIKVGDLLRIPVSKRTSLRPARAGGMSMALNGDQL
jgi:membrane-bound lytic murein transglycosylase D